MLVALIYMLQEYHSLALLRQSLLVDIVDPDALNDLEDFVSNIELIIELGMSSSGLDLCDKSARLF